ncbi:MAG: hypothetical protein ACLUDF_03790 [Butyricicoccus sp.]
MLINSGMAPMKPPFTGEQEPPRHRVTTCQKCIARRYRERWQTAVTAPSSDAG